MSRERLTYSAAYCTLCTAVVLVLVLQLKPTPPAVSTLYAKLNPTLSYVLFAVNCNQSTAPVPAGPLLAVDGALISAVLPAYSIFPTELRSNVGVRAASK
jgi:hypothetical protein